MRAVDVDEWTRGLSGLSLQTDTIIGWRMGKSIHG